MSQQPCSICEILVSCKATGLGSYLYTYNSAKLQPCAVDFEG